MVNAAQAAAELQSGIEKLLGVKPEIIKDTQTATAGEIIIGSTSRTVSGVNLNDNEYSIYTDSGRLVIQAGKSPLLTTAVNEFIKAVQNAGSISEDVPELRGTVSDFETVKNISGSTYKYVWGDEFNASYLDDTVWSEKGKEYGVPTDVKILNDENCITVKEGKLHLKTILYEDENNSSILFAQPRSIATTKSMNYKYGYLEIRAKVPVVQGSWCSFWLTTGKLNGASYPYGVEFDVFETASMLMKPNLHKWYTDSNNNLVDIAYNNSPNSKYHDFCGIKDRVIRDYTASDNFRNEYHTVSVEWTPEKIILRVDNTEYMTFYITDNEDFENYTVTGNDPSYGMRGFHNPMEVILGSGIYSPAFVYPHQTWAEKYMFDDDDNLPYDYEIDYIRLYQNDTGELKTN